jgi:hypothetical protein
MHLTQLHRTPALSTRGFFGALLPGDSVMKKDKGDGALPHEYFPRLLVVEAQHMILLESKKRLRLGLPNPKPKSVVNEWLIEMGKRMGHKPLGEGSK